MQTVLGFFGAFGLTVLLIIMLSPVAFRLGLVAHPNHRKNHSHPVPMIGGIAMVCCFLVVLPFTTQISPSLLYSALALALTCVIGILDDWHDLPVRWKFFLQSLACLIMIFWGGSSVQNLGNLFGMGVLHTGPVQVVFTLICFLGVINAINMVDGIDGLAGSIVIVSCLWYGLLAWLTGALTLLALTVLTTGAIAGFLVFNLRSYWHHHASVFMGDAGSMALGLLLAYFAIELGGQLNSRVTPITTVWILGLPLIDMAYVMMRRIRMSTSPFAPDNEHLHHMLLRAGCTANQTLMLMVSASFLLGAIGVIAWRFEVKEYVMFYAFMALLGLYSTAMYRISQRIRHSPGAEHHP